LVIWAGYAQFDSQITRRLDLSAGVRYDHYNSGFGGSTNPRFALIYHATSSTTAKLLYGSAFRAPVPYETNPDYGPFYLGNQKLQPETIRSVEGILEQGLGSRLNVTARSSTIELPTLSLWKRTRRPSFPYMRILRRQRPRASRLS